MPTTIAFLTSAQVAAGTDVAARNGEAAAVGSACALDAAGVSEGDLQAAGSAVRAAATTSKAVRRRRSAINGALRRLGMVDAW
ncbi:hypothetical protein CS0771_45850 [Catellatospora sp. IY07-71]|nr:hypothetical protein CS0771_45850 [Catellatospora sp. IY07-71]